MDKTNEILKVLKCSVCKELFSKPVTLMCQDTFCLGCVENKKECPICFRKIFVPPSHNYKLCEFMDMFLTKENMTDALNEANNRYQINKNKQELTMEEKTKNALKDAMWRSIVGKKKPTTSSGIRAETLFLPINTNQLATQYLNI